MLTKRELTKAINRYYEAQPTFTDYQASYEAMADLASEMYITLKLEGKEYTMTCEDGGTFEGDARYMAEMIHGNYSECEWVGFMYTATKKHGTYELDGFNAKVEW